MEVIQIADEWMEELKSLPYKSTAWDGRSAQDGLPSRWRENMEACLVLLGGRGLDR